MIKSIVICVIENHKINGILVHYARSKSLEKTCVYVWDKKWHRYKLNSRTNRTKNEGAKNIHNWEPILALYWKKIAWNVRLRNQRHVVLRNARWSLERGIEGRNINEHKISPRGHSRINFRESKNVQFLKIKRPSNGTLEVNNNEI